MDRIRLMLVDDHEVVRLGLRTLLSDEPDFQVVAEAGTAEEAMIQMARFRPDVVILDIQLPGRSGLDACRDILKQYPLTKVVVLTSHGSDRLAEQALRAGASGFVLKQVGNEELVRAVRAVHRGEMAIDPKTTRQVIARLNELQSQSEENAFHGLSPRELDVMVLVAHGKSNKEIGKALHLSEITVRNYVSTILEKLHLRNRIELATYAVQNRIEEHLQE